ncbi:hypothetical protein [Streptomyces sp. FIT100]|uniref:hypothetical protein n=1 Tax=Streptomyces sp. FIT100 TaxID=2837956 RepID=UPI0021CAB26F|nr:hypothetical protein [Streptomyces sp. FIT100]UUN27545.1 hypothetical protein KK483_14910 [Streptomyces sp. FIT100]
MRLFRAAIGPWSGPRQDHSWTPASRGRTPVSRGWTPVSRGWTPVSRGRTPVSRGRSLVDPQEEPAEQQPCHSGDEGSRATPAT